MADNNTLCPGGSNSTLAQSNATPECPTNTNLATTAVYNTISTAATVAINNTIYNDYASCQQQYQLPYQQLPYQQQYCYQYCGYNQQQYGYPQQYPFMEYQPPPPMQPSKLDVNAAAFHPLCGDTSINSKDTTKTETTANTTFNHSTNSDVSSINHNSEGMKVEINVDKEEGGSGKHIQLPPPVHVPQEAIMSSKLRKSKYNNTEKKNARRQEEKDNRDKQLYKAEKSQRRKDKKKKEACVKREAEKARKRAQFIKKAEEARIERDAINGVLIEGMNLALATKGGTFYEDDDMSSLDSRSDDGLSLSDSSGDNGSLSTSESNKGVKPMRGGGGSDDSDDSEIQVISPKKKRK